MLFNLNWYDYGFRNYDPQIGRFPQLDPLTDDYPELTPYQYASNDPILNIDIDGLEGGSSVLGYVSSSIGNAVITNASYMAPVIVKSTIKTATNTGLNIGMNIAKAGFSAVRIGLDGVNIPRPPISGPALDVGRFNLSNNFNSTPKSVNWSFSDVLETGSFAGEHGEKVLMMTGKKSLAKKIGIGGTILTGTSLVNNAVNKNWGGAIMDAADITFSNIAKTSPYYYAGKTLAWTFTGDFTKSKAYSDWEDEKKILINNFRYYRQIGNEAEVEKIQKKIIIIERGQAQIRKKFLPTE